MVGKIKAKILKIMTILCLAFIIYAIFEGEIMILKIVKFLLFSPRP